MKIGTWKKWGKKQGVKAFSGAETANIEADSWEDEEGKKVFLSLHLLHRKFRITFGPMLTNLQSQNYLAPES